MSHSTHNLRPVPRTHYFQYVDVILVNNEHTFTFQTFLEAATSSGLTEVEIKMYLNDIHDLRNDIGTEGLKEGFFWTNAGTAVGVFPKARGDDSKPRVVSSDEPDIAHLIHVAPELFQFDW